MGLNITPTGRDIETRGEATMLTPSPEATIL
jgi:hypothetical protein